MKNYRGNMLLIELIIVILFFSISQLVVVRLFASAQQTADNSRVMATALLFGEDVAEQLSSEENPDAALLGMGFVGSDGHYLYTSPQGFDVQAAIMRESRPSGTLLVSTLSIQANGRELFALPAACFVGTEAAR